VARELREEKVHEIISLAPEVIEVMPKFHVKKGEEVVVLAGKEKGKRGKIIAVMRKQQRVIVEGAQMISATCARARTSRRARLSKREGTIHLSNVMKADQFDARAAKRGGTVEPAKT